jgi:hypothetical protein
MPEGTQFEAILLREPLGIRSKEWIDVRVSLFAGRILGFSYSARVFLGFLGEPLQGPVMAMTFTRRNHIRI